MIQPVARIKRSEMRECATRISLTLHPGYLLSDLRLAGTGKERGQQ